MGKSEIDFVVFVAHDRRIEKVKRICVDANAGAVMFIGSMGAGKTNTSGAGSGYYSSASARATRRSSEISATQANKAKAAVLRRSRRASLGTETELRGAAIALQVIPALRRAVWSLV